MENEKDKIRIKHPELWIVLFVIAVATASVSFAFACHNYANEDPGLYLIDPIADEEVLFYGNDFSFYYYCDGEENVTTEKNNVRKSYSNKLKEIYAYLNEDNTYASYISLAAINEKPNEEVSIGTTLYSMLEKAYYYSDVKYNYSLFAGPLYEFWYHQFSYTQNYRVSNDPLNSEKSVNYLKQTADYINNKEHIDLKFLGEGKVKLTVSDDYKKYREEQAINSPYLTFNILKNSFILQAISDYLTEKNIDKGFIITNDGSVVQLKNSPLQTYSLYSVTDLALERAGDLTLKTNPSCGNVIRHFNLNNTSTPNYYYFTQDDVTYFRSLYLDISNGLQNNFLFSSGIYRNDLNILEAAIINNMLVPCASSEEIVAKLNSESKANTTLIINSIDNHKTFYINKVDKENVTLNDKLDYNLNIIKED